jgi:hypothetical protein
MKFYGAPLRTLNTVPWFTLADMLFRFPSILVRFPLDFVPIPVDAFK